jgi:hypothetical protein
MGTVRENIIELLRQGEFDAREISGRVGISEKDVAEHLTHISRSIGHKGLSLAVEPARCFDCGFRFKKRGRPKKPGRCPRCRSEHIDPPRFHIT